MLKPLHHAALTIASLAVLSMALIGGADVVSTVALSKPIPGVYEATELLMVCATVLAMGSLQAGRMSIAVDVLSSRLPAGAQRGIFLLSNLLGLCLFGLVAWQGWLIAWESLRTLEYAQGSVQIPVYPSKVAFATGMSLLVAQYARDIAHWREADSAPAAEDADRGASV